MTHYKKCGANPGGRTEASAPTEMSERLCRAACPHAAARQPPHHHGGLRAARPTERFVGADDPVRPGPITQHLVGQGPCALPGVRKKFGSGRCRHRPLRKRYKGCRKRIPQSRLRRARADCQASATLFDRKSSVGESQPRHFLGRELIRSTT